MSNKNLYKTIEEQQKIIQFLAEKYKNDTGCDVTLPQTWASFLGVKEEKAPIYEFPTKNEPYEMEKKGDYDSFMQAMAALNLPHKKADAKKSSTAQAKGDKEAPKPGKKQPITTNFDPNNKFHMIEVINLSGFAKKKFNRAAFRELLDSIADMRCLHTLILRDNGIDDNYVEELETLVENWRITSIDLSQNNIGKAGALALGKALKEKGGHIEWIENNFSEDYYAVNAICTGLKAQKNLYHFALTINTNDPKNNNFNLTEMAIKLLNNPTSVRSMSLMDSKLTQASISSLYNLLTNANSYLTGLCLKYCFLDTRSVYFLSKALEVNRTLVKLDLSCNGLSPIMGVYIVRSLKNNVTLTDLNLSKNCLNDDFAEALADMLRVNEIIWKVDLSYNPIGEQGAKAILKAIKESNDSLESLGDEFEANSASMGVVNVEEIRKVLKQNKVSKELRSRMLYEGRSLAGDDPKNITIPQTMYDNSQNFLDAELEDYKLFKPILFTNELFPEKQNIRLWNI